MIQYIYGRDVNDIMIKQWVPQKNGGAIKVQKSCFDAHLNTIDTSFSAADHRIIFGESRVTEALRISLDNQD